MRSNSLPPISPFLLRVSLVLGVVGTLASLGVHVAALNGFVLSFGQAFPFHIAAIAVAAPVILALIQRVEAELGPPPAFSLAYPLRVNAVMFRILSPAERGVFVLLLVYTLFRFLTGIPEAIRQPEEFPVALFSVFWLTSSCSARCTRGGCSHLVRWRRTVRNFCDEKEIHRVRAQLPASGRWIRLFATLEAGRS